MRQESWCGGDGHPKADRGDAAGLGEKDQALAWLEKAYEERSFQLQWLKIEPRWDSLRSDLRFQDLMRRVGLPQ